MRDGHSEYPTQDEVDRAIEDVHGGGRREEYPYWIDAEHVLAAEVKRLRAENADLREAAEGRVWTSVEADVAESAELDWFRRREVAMEQHPFRELPAGLYAWLLNNPKPGAGT